MDIGNNQVKLLKFVKDYIKKTEANLINSGTSSLCFFSSWFPNMGYAKLKLFSSGYLYLPKYLFLLAKNFLSIAKYNDYSLANKRQDNSLYNKIIISNCTASSFDKDGNFFDNNFYLNSGVSTSILWFLTSVDNKIPKNLNHNVRILFKNKKKKYSFVFFIKTILKIIKQNNYSIKNIKHELFVDSFFAKYFGDFFFNEIKSGNFKLVAFPYEGQPFLHNVSSFFKKKYSDIITVGYHSSLPPIPTSLIYRVGSPDLLLVNGDDQLFYLQTYLNWDADKVRKISSQKFANKSNVEILNCVYLPYIIFSEKIILNSIDDYLNRAKDFSLLKLTVRIHPSQIDNPIHIKMMEKINKTFSKYKTKFKNNEGLKNSIVVGPSALVVELLEKKINFVHLCVNPFFEVYSQNIWPNIQTRKLSKHLYAYNLKNYGKILDLNKSKTDFNEFFNDIINK